MKLAIYGNLGAVLTDGYRANGNAAHARQQRRVPRPTQPRQAMATSWDCACLGAQDRNDRSASMTNSGRSSARKCPRSSALPAKRDVRLRQIPGTS